MGRRRKRRRSNLTKTTEQNRQQRALVGGRLCERSTRHRRGIRIIQESDFHARFRFPYRQRERRLAARGVAGQGRRRDPCLVDSRAVHVDEGEAPSSPAHREVARSKHSSGDPRNPEGRLIAIDCAAPSSLITCVISVSLDGANACRTNRFIA